MAKKSLGQLLKNAEILQQAAKLTKNFGELNDTILQILREYLNQVQVQFAPNRPHDWENHLAVLQVTYGSFILKIPVPELKALDKGLATKVRIEMNENPHNKQEAQQLFAAIPDLPQMPGSLDSRWGSWYREIEAVGRGSYHEGWAHIQGSKVTRTFEFRFPKGVDPASVYKSRMGVTYLLYDKEQIDSFLRRMTEFEEAVIRAKPEARELFNGIGFNLSDKPYPVQEVEEYEDGTASQYEVMVDDRDGLDEHVAEAYFRFRDEWMLEDMRAIAQISDPAERVNAWKNAGIEVVAEAACNNGVMYQRTWSSRTTVLKGGEREVGGHYTNKRESISQHNHTVQVLPDPEDSIIFVVDHEGGDLDNYSFAVIDREVFALTES